jgi:putative transposase
MAKENKSMMKSFKYRLYPTRKQCEVLQFTLNLNHELYNAALQERRDAWRMNKVSVNFEMQSAQLPDIKEERPEFNEIYAQVLQETLHRVDKAFKNFFRRVKKGEKAGYPRFQGYDRYDSFTYPQIERLKGKSIVRIENGKVILPKIGHIKVKQHRPDGRQGQNLHHQT